MRSRLILITMAALTATASTAVAGPLGVWVVNPVSGDIIRVDPTTGGVLGAFPSPVQPLQDDRELGLTMAFGGNTLLYQLGPPPFTDERRMLYALDPFTGFVQTSGEISSASGPGGLSSVTKGNRTFVYWVHTSASGDIHRLENVFGGDFHEIVFWGPDDALAGGLGGDSTRRQFGVYCSGRVVQGDCVEDGVLFIGEFNPLVDGNSFRNTIPVPAPDTAGLAFDGRVLYASTSSGWLFSLNPNTGAALRPPVLLPGPHAFADGTQALHTFDIAAAPVPVPEPTLLTLLGVGLLGAVTRTVKARRRLVR